MIEAQGSRKRWKKAKIRLRLDEVAKDDAAVRELVEGWR